MQDIPRFITGILMVVIGLILIIVPLFTNFQLNLLIFGIIIFIIGAVILLNKYENEIEKVKLVK